MYILVVQILGMVPSMIAATSNPMDHKLCIYFYVFMLHCTVQNAKVRCVLASTSISKCSTNRLSCARCRNGERLFLSVSAMGIDCRSCCHDRDFYRFVLLLTLDTTKMLSINVIIIANEIMKQLESNHHDYFHSFLHQTRIIG